MLSSTESLTGSSLGVNRVADWRVGADRPSESLRRRISRDVRCLRFALPDLLWPRPEVGPPPHLIHRSAWKRNSRKFTVTSGRRYGFQGCRSLCTLAPPAWFKAQLIAFVARNCYKPLRLATAQLT